MSLHIPDNPKIYHLVHVDRLASIVEGGFLLSDTDVASSNLPGTTIGMDRIKLRRLHELTLTSHPGLCVGECVPFYFCPRSVMLYLIHRANHPDMTYKGGQDPIVHSEGDLGEPVRWATEQGLRWAFTLSNAGTRYFEDRCHIEQLGEIDWEAVQATDWKKCKEGKQAEFLIERKFPWEMVERIGVRGGQMVDGVKKAYGTSTHRPTVNAVPQWYY